MTATYTISIIIRISHLVEEAHTAALPLSVATKLGPMGY